MHEVSRCNRFGQHVNKQLEEEDDEQNEEDKEYRFCRWNSNDSNRNLILI